MNCCCLLARRSCCAANNHLSNAEVACCINMSSASPPKPQNSDLLHSTIPSTRNTHPLPVAKEADAERVVVQIDRSKKAVGATSFGVTSHSTETCSLAAPHQHRWVSTHRSGSLCREGSSSP